MATIDQAIDTLKKAGANITIERSAYSCRDIITIKFPLGTSWFEEIEGTVKMPETHYAVYEGFSNAIDQYTKNLKDFGTYKIPEVREIRYNGPATIVFWEDNTKTVVKMQPGEVYYDPDKAFAMAVCKKLFGNKFNRHLTKAQKAFDKYWEAEYEKERERFDNIIENFLKLFNPSANSDSEGKKEN